MIHPCLSKHSSEFSHGSLGAQPSGLCVWTRVQRAHHCCSAFVLASKNTKEPEKGTCYGPETHLEHLLINACEHMSLLPSSLETVLGWSLFTAAHFVMYLDLQPKQY